MEEPSDRSMTTSINSDSEMIYLFDSPDIMSAFAPLPPLFSTTASPSNKKQQKKGLREIVVVGRSTFNRPVNACYSKGATHPDQEPSEDDAKLNTFRRDAVVSFRSSKQLLPAKGRFESRADSSISPFYRESVHYSTEEQSQNIEATYSTSALCYPESGCKFAESCNESFVHDTTSLHPRNIQMVTMMRGQMFPPSLPQYDQSEACQKRDLIAFDSFPLFPGDMFANEELVKEDTADNDSIKEDLDQMASIGKGGARDLTADIAAPRTNQMKMVPSNLFPQTKEEKTKLKMSAYKKGEVNQQSLSSTTGTESVKGTATRNTTAPGQPMLICHLIQPSDRQLTSKFTAAVFDQMEVIFFDEKDRRNNRTHIPSKYPGLQCRHCKPESGRGGRYFSSTFKTLADSRKTLFAIERHLTKKCSTFPDELKTKIIRLRDNHEEEIDVIKSGLGKSGFQRNFYRRIWSFLRAVDEDGKNTTTTELAKV